MSLFRKLAAITERWWNERGHLVCYQTNYERKHAPASCEASTCAHITATETTWMVWILGSFIGLLPVSLSQIIVQIVSKLEATNIIVTIKLPQNDFYTRVALFPLR
jgi:hypothetical protein